MAIFRNRETESSLRRQGFALLKTNWLPILLFAILILGIALATGVSQMIVIQRMQDRVTALRPEGLNPTEMVIRGLKAPDDYDFEGWQNYQEALRTLETKTDAVQFLLRIPRLLLVPILSLGIFRGLIRALQGGVCTWKDVFSGFRRGGRRAIWLDIQRVLRAVGYILIVLLAAQLLSIFPLALQKLLAIMAIIPLVGFMLWLDCRYMLAPLSLADERHAEFTATDHIHHGMQDVASFGYISLLVTLAPAVVLNMASSVVKELSLGWTGVAAMAVLECTSLAISTACLPVIYLHLNGDQPEEEPDEGLARARALMNESY